MPPAPLTCPICSSPSSESWVKSGFQLYQCGTCDHLYCRCAEVDGYIDQTYGDDYFEGGGGGYDDYLQHEKLLVAQGIKYANVLSRHGERGKMLDVGAAAGFLLKGFVESGWKGVGVEPNQKMAAFAAESLGLDVVAASIEEAIGSLSRQGPFDAATLVQVISHLQDPMDCLTQVRSVLRPRGLLLIETWNRRSLAARGFGKNWHQYNPPSVLHWYTKKHLAEMLDTAGFEVVDQGRPTKWISLGNGFSLLRHSMKDSLIGRIATLPTKLIPKKLKVPYFLDDVFWMVARKRS